VKMVVLTHLVTGRRSGEDSKYVEAVKQQYSGQVVVAHDLLEL
jgi:ribonuclease BN (tRNA processing enzyme)